MKPRQTGLKKWDGRVRPLCRFLRPLQSNSELHTEGVSVCESLWPVQQVQYIITRAAELLGSQGQKGIHGSLGPLEAGGREAGTVRVFKTSTSVLYRGMGRLLFLLIATAGSPASESFDLCCCPLPCDHLEVRRHCVSVSTH